MVRSLKMVHTTLSLNLLPLTPIGKIPKLQIIIYKLKMFINSKYIKSNYECAFHLVRLVT